MIVGGMPQHGLRKRVPHKTAGGGSTDEGVVQQYPDGVSHRHRIGDHQAQWIRELVWMAGDQVKRDRFRCEVATDSRQLHRSRIGGAELVKGQRPEGGDGVLMLGYLAAG